MFTCELPSGNTVVMKSLTFRDRQSAVRTMKAAKDEGYLLEELMASMAIISINGHEFPQDLISDPISRFDTWSLPDTQYYLEFFMTLNSIDEKTRKNAEEQAKKCLGVIGESQAVTRKASAPKA
jgi:hypothetical protein